MQIVTLDFETYFDKEYTLSKLTTESYVRDPRFEILGCAVRYADGDKEWLPADADLKSIVDAHDAVLCHHAQFDGFILAHHYGARPRVWLDTLSMARLCLGNHLSVGLDSLAKHFGLAAKTVPYAAFKGKHWNELDPATQHAVVTGSLHDVDLTWHLFNLLLPHMPDEEMRLIDMTIRMFTEPVLMGDVELLGQVWSAEDKRKQELLNALGTVASELQSAEKFAALLRLEGIEPPMKETAAGKAYAFARTDKFMTEELLEHPDDRIRTLAEARLGVRSTIEQTRAERIGRMALRGPLPVYLSYCGAHTTRWSGGDKVNWQNFKRRSLIRSSIRAPARHRVLKADKSQVECVAEDTPVLTDKGSKPIQEVELDDRVWDGQEWVTHEGVVCRGEKTVISFQGLTATPDHLVYTRRGAGKEAVEMSFAAAHSIDLLPADAPTAVCQAAMRECDLPRLQALWRAWNKIQIQVNPRSGAVGAGALATRELRRLGDRPQKQRWSLRTGKLAALHAARKCQQSIYDLLGANKAWPSSYAGLQTCLPGLWIWSGCDPQAGAAGADGGAGSDALALLKREAYQQAQGGTARAIQKARVYDIVNAGPRHRFAAAGVIVSNCRYLNMLAGQSDVIERFRNKQDPYITIASEAYGHPVYKPKEGDPRYDEMTQKRGTGKQLELSCLGPDTRVLTDNGPKPITEVQATDRLWDGVEWVTHRGVLSRGERTVMWVAGLSLTPDHRILCGDTWLEARSLRDANILSLALASGSASLPSPATWWRAEADCAPSWCLAPAARLNTRRTRIIFSSGRLRAATLALKKRAATGLRNITAMLTCVLMTRTVAACSDASALFFPGAPREGTRTMVDAAFTSMPLGARTGKNFSATWWDWLAGTSLNWSLTASTTKRVTRRETSGLLHTRKTASTVALWRSSKKKMLTYDIACSGPRQRFTVLSSIGPLIVHNCGYGAGGATIQATAAKGTYGPPVKINIEQATAWRDLYRKTHPRVVQFWHAAGQLLERVASKQSGSWSIFNYEDGRIYLPNGAPLIYAGLEWATDPETGTGFWRYRSRFGWRRIWGGFLVENLIQAVSRVDIGQCMLRLQDRGYHIALMEHDAVAVVVKEENAEHDLQVVLEEMRRAPDWLPDIPLDAEGSVKETYS